jgi:hypothetical protein
MNLEKKPFDPTALAADLHPVRARSLRSLAVRYFVTLAGILEIAWVALAGGHPDAGRWGRPDFLLALPGVALGLACVSILLAQHARPGAVVSRPLRRVFWLSLALASLLGLARLSAPSAVRDTDWGVVHGWPCAMAAWIVGAIAAGAVVIQLRREAPVRPLGAARLLLLAAGLVGLGVLQLHCLNDHPVHQALWHALLPLALLAACARTVSRRTLRW